MSAPAGIRLIRDAAGVAWEAVKADLAADHFDNGRTPAELASSFAASAHVCLAVAGDGAIVGTARLLADGVCNAYLVDVWTRADHRRRGVARAMVEDLLADVPGHHVGLFTDDSVAVYERLGFEVEREGMSQVVGNWLRRPGPTPSGFPTASAPSGNPPPNVTVRRATGEDADELGRLRWALSAEFDDHAGGAGFDAFAQTFRQWWRRSASDWIAIVAQRSDGGLVGNVWICVVPKMPKPGREADAIGYLTNVYVQPQARDQGLGSRLLAAARAEAVAAGCELLVVWPSERSVPVYRRAGFVPPIELLELALPDTGLSTKP